MVMLSDVLDTELLMQHVRDGYVTMRRHNELPYVIYNYTPKCQYDWKWDDVTRKTRGLIVDANGEIVARPFEKFFNWDQGVGSETWQNPMPPPGPCLRMEKMDGSLGVLYPVYKEKFNGGRAGEFVVDWAMATRGSFHSEQAEWATEFFQSYLDDVMWPEHGFEPRTDKTYLFEIIYPENRIVVDYGDYKGLVLIDVIDNATGRSDLQEFDDCEWPDKVKRQHLNLGFDSGQANDIPNGDEGFVYLWPEKNFRTKMKSADYIELHRIISRLSEKSIWEMLVAGKDRKQIKASLPDEFYGFVDKVVDDIEDRAEDLVGAAIRAHLATLRRLGETEKSVSRKEYALAVKDHPLRKYLFLALDKRPLYGVALQDSKPDTDRALVSTEDI